MDTLASLARVVCFRWRNGTTTLLDAALAARLEAQGEGRTVNETAMMAGMETR